MKNKLEKTLKNSKKKSKTLRILLKIISVWLLIFAFTSCKDNCDKEFLKVLDAAEKGNVKVVENYINNGGEFSDNCFDYKNGRMGGTRDLLSSALDSETIALMKLICSKIDTLEENTKSVMIDIALKKKDDDFLEFLIKETDAHVTWIRDIKLYSLKNLKKLNKYNYNFNWNNPYNGNTILMWYVNSSRISEDDLLEIVQYLLVNGANADIKNKRGETAEDMAVNKKVKEYLKNLE